MAKTVAVETVKGFGSDLKEIGKSVLRGFGTAGENLLINAPEALASLYEHMPESLGGLRPEHRAEWEREKGLFEKEWAEPGRQMFQVAERYWKSEDPALQGPLFQQLRKNPAKALTVGLAENVPQLLVTIGAAAVHPAAGLTVAGASEAGGAWKEAKTSGATDEQAAYAAGLTAIPNMLLEYLPAGKIVRSVFKGVAKEEVAGVVRGLVKQAVAEGATETLQEMNSVLAGLATYAGDKGLSFHDLKSMLSPENLERYGAAGTIGFLLGGGTDLAMHGSHGSQGQGPHSGPQSPRYAPAPELPTEAAPPASSPRASPPDPLVAPPGAEPLHGRVLPFPNPQPEPGARAPEPPPHETLPREPVPHPPPKRRPTLPGEPARLVPPPTPEPAEPSAPVAPAMEPPPFVLGRRDRTFTERGRPVEFDFALMEARDARTSHDDVLRPDPGYPQELQPRDRDRAASAVQVSSIEQNLNPELVGESAKASDGAPIVGPDGVVEGGNARTIGIRRAYRAGNEGAQAYRAWLAENASRFGLLPEAVASMEHPLLVRVRRSDVADRAELGRELNESGVAAMSATEKARADAARISPEMLDRLTIPESGEVNWAANKEFVDGFAARLPPSEQGALFDRQGYLSREGQERLRNAVLARAYDDSDAVAKLIEDRDSNVRTVGAGVLREAPRIARLRTDIERGALHDRDLGPDVAAAVRKLSALRSEGMKVGDYLAQGEMFHPKLTPEARELLGVFDRFGRSGRAIGDLLSTYSGLVESLGHPDQGSLFGSSPEPPSKLDLLRTAVQEVEQGRQTSLLEPAAGGAGGRGRLADLGDAETGAGVRHPEQRTLDRWLGRDAPEGGTGTSAEGGSGPQGPRRSVDTEGEHLPLELPEIVELLQHLGQGKLPRVRAALRAAGGRARGLFHFSPGRPGSARVEVRADIAKDPAQAARTLAHEAGHWVGSLPEGDLGRGNILGHLAALHRYLKSMIDELPADPSRVLTKAERTQIRTEAGRQAREELGKGHPNLGARAREIFQERLQGEMSSRRLVDRATVMDELRRVSSAWRGPFEKGHPYRDSPEELYADGFSALLNDPGLLKREAPTFHSLFFNYLERRPQVKEIYEAIQGRIGGGRENVLEKRWQRYLEPIAKGAAARAEQMAERDGSFTLANALVDGVLDRNSELYRRVRAARRRGAALDPKANPIYWAEEMAYHASEAAWYLDRFKADVLDTTRGAGVNDTELGALLALSRAGGERAELFNPLGEQGGFARQLEAYGLEKLGPEKAAAVQKAARSFWDLRQEVLSQVEDSGAFSPQFVAHAKGNPGYVKFYVTSYLGKEGFSQATGQVHRQIGTLQEIGNPALETALTDLALLRVAHRTQTAKAIRRFHEEFFPDEITPAKRGRGGQLLETNQKGLSTVFYLDGGKVRAYHVSSRVASLFESDPYKTNAAYSAYSLMTRPLRALLVDRNPWWAVWNLHKDAKAFARQVVTSATPGDTRARRIGKTLASPVTSSYETMRYLVKALPDAARDVFLNERTEAVRAMLQGRMLVETGGKPLSSSYAADDLDSREAIDALLRRFGVEDAPATSAGQRLLERLWDWAGRPGELTERLVKVAGYKYLKANQERLQLGDKEIAHRVRTLAGTPDVLRRGDWFKVTNSVFLFSNVGKEGFRSAVEAARLNPGEYAAKTLAFEVLPKLVMLGAAYGFFGEALKDFFARVSEYDKRNYLILPWGTTPAGKAVFTRIPRDHMGQLVGSATWLLFSDQTARGDLFDFLDQNLPYSPAALHPYITSGLATTAYLRGKNPQDPYSGHPMVPERTFDAGGGRSHRALARALWNELGGETLIRFETEDPGEAADHLQRALRLPLIGPALSRFVKVSDYGTSERLRKLDQEERGRSAERSLDLEEVLRRGLEADPEASAASLYREAREAGLDPGRLSDFKQRVSRFKARSSADPYERAKSSAPNKAARLRIDALRQADKKTSGD